MKVGERDQELFTPLLEQPQGLGLVRRLKQLAYGGTIPALGIADGITGFVLFLNDPERQKIGYCCQFPDTGQLALGITGLAFSALSYGVSYYFLHKKTSNSVEQKQYQQTDELAASLGTLSLVVNGLFVVTLGISCKTSCD